MEGARGRGGGGRDVLLDDYEKNMTAERLDEVFVKVGGGEEGEDGAGRWRVRPLAANIQW